MTYFFKEFSWLFLYDL